MLFTTKAQSIQRVLKEISCVAFGPLRHHEARSIYSAHTFRCRDDGMLSILRYFVTVRRATG